MELLWSRRFFRHQDWPNQFMSYIDVIFVIWCHNDIWCHMTHMTSKYDMSQFGRSWCLKKRLDHRNWTHLSVLGLTVVSTCKYWKTCQTKKIKFFPLWILKILENTSRFDWPAVIFQYFLTLIVCAVQGILLNSLIRAYDQQTRWTSVLLISVLVRLV